MAEVYDRIKGVKGGVITRTLPNGYRKQSIRNGLERVIALHEDVQARLVHEGQFIYRRADFRLKARQQRHVMRLKEALADAIKGGDPDEIRKAQYDLNTYLAQRTQVTWSQADVDVHVSLYRPDGNEFFVEVDGQGDRGVEVLRDSLTH